jgi:DNA invertase Pin-like site-specific DNA recombinase
MRAVIYARYSSDNQREASIEDQLEICRRYIGRQGWTLLSRTFGTDGRKAMATWSLCGKHAGPHKPPTMAQR